jgi:iron complex transport system substrate-binding protein
VFSDKYFNGQWFVPGGKSYIARLFQDAGATYLWENDVHTASFPLDFEVVYQKANDADYWRIIGSYSDQPSYKGLAMENELYRRFRAYREKKVIYCNARETAYFENSPLEPHIILADLINVFHPGLLHDYKPTYYKLLED